MTRKELFEAIEKYHLTYKVKQITGKNYTNCSNAKLEEVVLASVGSKLPKEEPKKVAIKKATIEAKKEVDKNVEFTETTSKEELQPKEEPKPKKKTIEEMLAEIDSKVNSYRQSSNAIITKGKELDYYSKIIKILRNENNQFCIANYNYSSCIENPEHVEKYTLLEREKEYFFEDQEFIKDILICILSEKIEKITESINSTKEKMAKL